jgi:DNA-binding NtrC family response regulator
MNAPTLAPIRVKQQSVIDLINKELQEGRGIEAIGERFHNCVIVQALTLTGGNVSRAAVILKTARNNLVRWMQESGIDSHFPISPNLGD